VQRPCSLLRSGVTTEAAPPWRWNCFVEHFRWGIGTVEIGIAEPPRRLMRPLVRRAARASARSTVAGGRAVAEAVAPAMRALASARRWRAVWRVVQDCRRGAARAAAPDCRVQEAAGRAGATRQQV